jgi:hypothetical protein
MKNRIFLFLLSTISYFLVFGCFGFKEAEVTITKDYVINPNWGEVSNSFRVIKMKYKNVNDIINLQNASPPDMLNKLIEDTSFSFVTNVKFNGEKFLNRKVYFNKYNGFTWGKFNDIHSNYRQRTIGDLQKETWYLLSGLSNVKTLYYVYIDSLENLHTFRVPASYYTNY